MPAEPMDTRRCQTRALDPMELELLMVVSYGVVAGNQTDVLCRRSK